jgi:hypothetical protein
MFIQKNLIGLLYYDQPANVCILYDPTLFYSVCLIYFGGTATAFDIFGTDNAEELLTCGFQYPAGKQCGRFCGNLLYFFPADCFGIKQEIVFGVTYVLSVQYSCAVVSVFLLWWES